jgi:hypothetical protein
LGLLQELSLPLVRWPVSFEYRQERKVARINPASNNEMKRLLKTDDKIISIFIEKPEICGAK